MKKIEKDYKLIEIYISSFAEKKCTDRDLMIFFLFKIIKISSNKTKLSKYVKYGYKLKVRTSYFLYTRKAILKKQVGPKIIIHYKD